MTIDSYGVNGRKHLWVALDPGIRTGWALLGDDGTVLGQGTFIEDNLWEGLDKLIRGSHRSGRQVTVAIEQMPSTGGVGELAQRLERVRQLIDELVVETYDLPVRRYPPGQWKTSRVGRTAVAHPDAKTQHEIDAQLLGLYAIRREMKHAK